MKDAATLSEREKQIAEMIAWGSSKKEIASLLFISERTVENHTRAIFKKVGVSKSNELSAWWFCTKHEIPFKLIKPYLKLREAHRLYGESIVNRWIKEGLIKTIKDGNRTASVRISRIQIEAVAKTSNRANYLSTAERQ